MSCHQTDDTSGIHHSSLREVGRSHRRAVVGSNWFPIPPVPEVFLLEFDLDSEFERLTRALEINGYLAAAYFLK